MWDSEMVNILRHMIGDLEEPYTYSDDRLEKTILMSAQFVSNDIVWSTTYTVDMDEMILSPDPTDRDAGTRDNNFMNLVLLKAACFIETSEARTAAGQAITIRDQGSMIGLGGSGGVAESRYKLWEKNFCKQYQDTKNSYAQTGSAIGIAVSGPLPNYADNYISRYR